MQHYGVIVVSLRSYCDVAIVHCKCSLSVMWDVCMWAVYMGWWSATTASGVIGLGTWSRGVLRGRLGDETDCSGSMCSGSIAW